MLSLLLSSCTNLGLFAANLPTYFDSSLMRHKKIVFDATRSLSLDIYRAKDLQPKAPVLVFLYGGRWTYGQKEQYAFVGEALAKKGFVVVIPDYRKYPQVKFPGFVEDGAKALAWIHDHIQTYGGNPDEIHLAGHSAGANIGALLASDPTYLKQLGKDRSLIKSFAGLAGPYDFTPDEKDLMDMFGPENRYPLMRPTTYADQQTPPMLLLHGAKDTTVGLFNLKNLQTKLETTGACVKTKVYAGIDHTWIVGVLSWAGRNKAPVLEDMVSFFNMPQCRKGQFSAKSSYEKP
jgi:acetyl esterase/lipase